jgi:hypothetical protein
LYDEEQVAAATTITGRKERFSRRTVALHRVPFDWHRRG